MIYNNGDKYEGDLKIDLKEGGIYYYNNGDKYEGEYKRRNYFSELYYL